MSDLDGDRLGAYGLELVPPLCPSSLAPVGEGWLPVEIVCGSGGSPPARNYFDESRFEFSFGDDGGLVVTAEPRRAVFRMTEPRSEAELVHPYLAPAAGAFAWWSGREAFHAGAFATDDGIWALVGDRGTGKSSTLAGLAQAGYGVVCDDLLVVDSGMALAGPRCLDLRPPVAERLGVGEFMVRGREKRWRLALGPVPPARRLAGWIFLEWGDKVSAAPVPGSARLARLARNRSLFIPPRRPVRLLELAALPAWELRRPQTWSSLPRAIDRLLELTVH
jgi:hypothetical protein